MSTSIVGRSSGRDETSSRYVPLARYDEKNYYLNIWWRWKREKTPQKNIQLVDRKHRKVVRAFEDNNDSYRLLISDKISWFVYTTRFHPRNTYRENLSWCLTANCACAEWLHFTCHAQSTVEFGEMLSGTGGNFEVRIGRKTDITWLKDRLGMVTHYRPIICNDTENRVCPLNLMIHDSRGEANLRIEMITVHFWP